MPVSDAAALAPHRCVPGGNRAQVDSLKAALDGCAKTGACARLCRGGILGFDRSKRRGFGHADSARSILHRAPSLAGPAFAWQQRPPLLTTVLGQLPWISRGFACSRECVDKQLWAPPSEQCLLLMVCVDGFRTQAAEIDQARDQWGQFWNLVCDVTVSLVHSLVWIRYGARCAESNGPTRTLTCMMGHWLRVKDTGSEVSPQ